jgi:hypothetical protein
MCIIYGVVFEFASAACGAEKATFPPAYLVIIIESTIYPRGLLIYSIMKCLCLDLVNSTE